MHWANYTNKINCWEYKNVSIHHKVVQENESSVTKANQLTGGSKILLSFRISLFVLFKPNKENESILTTGNQQNGGRSAFGKQIFLFILF